MHSDVHESNLLCDEGGTNVVLCDFPTTSIWGEIVSQKERMQDGRVVVPFDVFDGRLDRFQVAKLMLRLECGDDAGDVLAFEDENICLARPVQTGNNELDVVITGGLLAQYKDTRAMLAAVEAIAVVEGLVLDAEQASDHDAQRTKLSTEVAGWRTERVRTNGKLADRSGLPFHAHVHAKATCSRIDLWDSQLRDSMRPLALGTTYLWLPFR